MNKNLIYTHKEIRVLIFSITLIRCAVFLKNKACTVKTARVLRLSPGVHRIREAEEKVHRFTENAIFF